MMHKERLGKDVFVQGEEGCHTYRMPSLAQAPDGTLIALAEGRLMIDARQRGKDEGASFPVEIMVGPGPSAYSDLAALDDGSVGILWEGGKESCYEKIIFTRLTAGIRDGHFLR